MWAMDTLVVLLAVGAATASTLWIGALIGAYWKAPDWLLGVLIAFASGALITALAFDLFEGAVEDGGIAAASIGLAIGTVLFVVIDHLIERYSQNGSGLGLLAAVTTDGIPENLALGVALIGASVSEVLALLVAICASNLPEALGGAAKMWEGEFSSGVTFGIWVATGVLLAIAILIGNLSLQGASDETLATIRAIAAGAVLAALADELMPQAYRQANESIVIATAAGFLLTFLLT